MSPTTKPRPSEEERLMALLALDAQELPAKGSGAAPDLASLDGRTLSSEKISELHAYLDAHPDAFEEMLRQRSAATSRNAAPADSWQTRIARWMFPVPRYAIGLVASAVVAVGISFMWIASQDRLSDAVDSAYADLSARVPAQALIAALESVSPSQARLGFSAEARPVDSGQASFSAGFNAGRLRLLQARDEGAASTNETMYVLGQWNAVLWTAAALPEPVSTEFWNTQSERFQEFAADARRQRRVDPVVIVHVQRVETLLAQLSQRHSARATYELSQELQLFRARFVP
jgi:hypothetical protein